MSWILVDAWETSLYPWSSGEKCMHGRLLYASLGHWSIANMWLIPWKPSCLHLLMFWEMPLWKIITEKTSLALISVNIWLAQQYLIFHTVNVTTDNACDVLMIILRNSLMLGQHRYEGGWEVGWVSCGNNYIKWHE